MASVRARLARLDADLAAARLRLERLEESSAFASPADASELAAALARVEADIAELEEARAELAGTAPTEAPTAQPAAATAAADASSSEWLTTAEAAAVLRVTVKGLERMRAQGRGPPFTRVGRSVRYRRSDLERAK